MTMRQIAETLDWPLPRVHSVLMGARKRYPGKMVRVVRYVEHPERGKDVQVFAAGPGKDKPRPVLTEQERRERRRVVQDRYNRKNRKLIDTKARIKRAKAKGVDVPGNHWFQLMPPEVRRHVSQMAMAG